MSVIGGEVMCIVWKHKFTTDSANKSLNFFKLDNLYKKSHRKIVILDFTLLFIKHWGTFMFCPAIRLWNLETKESAWNCKIWAQWQ